MKMDAEIKKFCPNCSNLYHLKCNPPQHKGTLPVFLTCGHTICEGCVKNILRFAEPIECKVCHQSTEIDKNDSIELVQNNKEFYKKFPVNMFMLGELTMELIHDGHAKNDESENYFVDLKSIIQKTEYTTGQCVECYLLTSKMCQQCEMILCESCFNKSHKNFVMFKNHFLKNIEPLNSCNKCKIHTDKTLDYYCKDCGKSICMDCFMVGGDKSCKNHDVTSMKEVNEGFLEDLSGMFPKVDETFRRLTKTAVNVGNLLYNLEHETGAASEVTQLITNLEQHFSKLNFVVQNHKSEIVQMVTQLKCSEKESLYKAKEEITHSIKKAKEVLNLMSQSLNPKKMKQINLSVVLEDAKQVAETPWYLKKNDTNNETINLTVKEEVCNQINEYVKLEGRAQSGYSLCSTAELGDIEIPPPPAAPVYPPEMPKDVRQQKQRVEKVVTKASKPSQGPHFLQAPMFRSKTRSTSSLNSTDSDGSSSHNGSSRHYDAHPHQRPFVDPVTPYVNKVQKQLHKGCQEIIYISHIVNPHNFYVQRACHQGLIKELFSEFRNAVSSPKPSAAHITEGKLYLMLNKLDGTWQRCRVVSVERKNPNKPTCTVHCIDFGSTEVVSLENLRLLQPARVQSPPPLAINCSLANCVPKSGAWTCDDSYLIQNIINNKQAVMYVRDIRQHDNSEQVTLVCDVTTVEHGVSLAHALVFHERARMPNPKLQYPKISGLTEKPKLFMVNNNLKLKCTEEVYITHIVSPDKFYIRERHLKDIYEKLCEDMEAEYSTALSNNNDCIYLPEVGMVCVVNMEKYRSEGEPAWARGVVLELPGRARARVLLADCGADRLVHCSALRPPRARLTTLRALATECHLAGVTPQNKKWSALSVALLRQYQDKVLELRVEDNRNRGSLGVVLYDNSGEDPVCINNEMIKYKFAISFGLYRFNVTNKNEETLIDKSPIEHQPKPAQKRPPQLTILKEKCPKENEDNLEAKDKGPLRLEVTVLQYQSPSLIYVSMVHQQSTFSQMFDELQKHYSNENPPSEKSDWKEGDRCCAFNETTKTWRRAVIMELEGENAKLFYADFALVDTVPLSGLRELTPQFQTLGDAAIKCHLSGVVPAVGTEWPSLTKEYLKELLEAYKRLFITKMGNFKDKSMPVELWVYHTVQGGALEPDMSEWRCLNKKIIDQGLGVPDKSQEPPAESGNAKKDDDDEMLSFLNVTGSVREWLQLEPRPVPPPAKPESIDDNTNPSTPEVCDTPGSSKMNFISDWLPPEPLQCTEFTAVPTYIDNDGVVYLHQSSQLDTLDLIRKALEVRFRKPDPKAKHMKWTVGEPCVALYFLDNRFYRGRVIDVNTENSTCFVQYVDYGNEEVCSFENMRKGVVLHQIPVQAHKCILTRIRPTGNQWDRTTLDYIHKSIVEKHCLVKVAGKPVGELVPIELNYDKLCINDHLVDFEMAEYTDGSKPVVTKFVPEPTFKEHTPDDLKSDSGPDYVVDDLSPPPQDCTFDPKFLEYDWNLLVEEENQTNITKNVTFMINDTEEFLSNISMINDHDTLELNIIHKDEDNVLYEEMLEEVKKESAELRPLCGIFENKACVALYPEDGLWYRASILKQNKSKNLVKLRYVDYGNTEVVSTSNVREIDTKWLKLPPASIQVQFYNAKINPHADITKLFNILTDSGPFQTKIASYENSIAQVELRNQDGELVNDKLIRSGYLI